MNDNQLPKSIDTIKRFYNPVVNNPKLFTPTALATDFYIKHLGFFCNKEIQFDKVTKMPVRFRLGSVSYTDKMEGKNNFNPGQQVRH